MAKTDVLRRVVANPLDLSGGTLRIVREPDGSNQYGLMVESGDSGVAVTVAVRSFVVVCVPIVFLSSAGVAATPRFHRPAKGTLAVINAQARAEQIG